MGDVNPVEQAAAARLRELRQAAGWSQEQMARRMAEAGHPWHQQTVGRIESGRQALRLGELVDLAAIFGVDPASFFGTLDVPSATAMRIAIEREVREQIAAEIRAAA